MSSDTNVFKYVVYVVVALFVLSIIFGSFGTIGAGERGIRTRFNAVTGTVPQGLYFKMPFLEKVSKMDVKTRTISADKLSGASRDLQDVFISVAINYHINPEKVTDIFTHYSSTENFENNVIVPIVNQVVKTTSAQYTAEELVTKRAEFSDKVNSILAEKITPIDAVLERFSVTNFEFSKSFSQAIEAKVTATQNAEAARNKLEQIKFEAQQKIETAKAEAEAIKIQASAINSQGGEDYVRLQAIKLWDGKGCVNNCFGVGTQMPIPFLNVK